MGSEREWQRTRFLLAEVRVQVPSVPPIHKRANVLQAEIAAEALEAEQRAFTPWVESSSLSGGTIRIYLGVMRRREFIAMLAATVPIATLPTGPITSMKPFHRNLFVVSGGVGYVIDETGAIIWTSVSPNH